MNKWSYYNGSEECHTCNNKTCFGKEITPHIYKRGTCSMANDIEDNIEEWTRNRNREDLTLLIVVPIVTLSILAVVVILIWKLLQ